MNDPIKPTDQRPEHPDFWCKRFGEGVTPWDAGQVPADFAAFVAAQARPLRTLIPGCGSAWEARHLAEYGWPVTALDFSPQAVACAREAEAAGAAGLMVLPPMRYYADARETVQFFRSVADATSLRWAFALLVPVLLVVVAMAPHFRTRA